MKEQVRGKSLIALAAEATGPLWLAASSNIGSVALREIKTRGCESISELVKSDQHTRRAAARPGGQLVA